MFSQNSKVSKYNLPNVKFSNSDSISLIDTKVHASESNSALINHHKNDVKHILPHLCFLPAL